MKSEVLTLENLKRHNDKIICSVGPRYTKEVNIQTDYLNYFEPLLRTQRFRDSILELIGKFARASNELCSKLSQDKFSFDQSKVAQIKRFHSLLIPSLFEIKTDKIFFISYEFRI